MIWTHKLIGKSQKFVKNISSILKKLILLTDLDLKRSTQTFQPFNKAMRTQLLMIICN